MKFLEYLFNLINNSYFNKFKLFREFYNICLKNKKFYNLNVLKK